MARKVLYLFSLLALLLAAGCGEVPTVPPRQEPTLGPDQSGVTLLPADTPMPYPMPTRAPFTPPPLPTATPLPVVPVLGAEWAPEAERETYIVTTVVVAPVGDGPGEVGVETFGPTPPKKADQFTVDGHGHIYILDVVNNRVVKFDAQGRFTQNISYPGRPELWYPELIAVDMEGRVYLYDEGVNPDMAGVYLFDAQGALVQKYPAPSWFHLRRIRAMRVDEQGTLWVGGAGYFPNAPIIEDGQPYSLGIVPLGNATEVFDEDHQKARAVAGHLLPSGRPMIVYATIGGAGPAYIYDSAGRPLYRVSGLSAIDLDGNLYYAQETNQGYTIIKWDTQGRRIASFDLPFCRIRVEGDGTVYCLGVDRENWDAYYVMRAQPKER